MQHIHATTCPHCDRDLYLIISGTVDGRWLGGFDLFHLDEAARCIRSTELRAAAARSPALAPSRLQQLQQLQKNRTRKLVAGAPARTRAPYTRWTSARVRVLVPWLAATERCCERISADRKSAASGRLRSSPLHARRPRNGFGFTHARRSSPRIDNRHPPEPVGAARRRCLALPPSSV
jgi:hypothetical protein